MNVSSGAEQPRVSASGQEVPRPLHQPRNRRRPALSCVQCRNRKVKCDRTVPCSRCVRSKKTVCMYEPEPGHIQTSSTNATTMAKKPSLSLRNQERTIDLSDDPMISNGLYTPNPSVLDDPALVPSNHLTPEKADGVRTLHPEVNTQQLKDRVRQLETMVSSLIQSGQSPTENTSLTTVIQDPIIRGNLDKTRFCGMGHWMNVKKEFAQIHSLKSVDKSDNNAEIPKLLKNCKTLARAVKAQRPTNSYVHPDFRSHIPPRETSNLLVQYYFQYLGSTYRILHRQLFYKEYERYWSHPQDADTSFTVKLLLVVAIGTIFLDDSTDGNCLSNLVPQWTQLAQGWLNSPGAKTRINLTGVEVQCLLILAQQLHSLDGDMIWITSGSVLRTAMSVGLHRDPSHFPKMTVFYAELRRRLWSTVLELATQSSLDCAMPPLFSLDDFDCQPPSNYDDADIDEQTKEYPPRKADNISTESSIQIYLRRSLSTRLEICKRINDFHSNPAYEKVLALGTELTSHIRSHSQLYQQYQSSEVPFAISHMNHLDLLTRRFLLALHLPFAVQARTNPQFYFSRKVALEAAMVILSYPETGDCAEGFTRMQLTSGGCFRETFFLAATTVGLELINQINEDSSSPFMPGPYPSSIARKPLHDAMDSVVTLSRRRLESVETNAKGYMFPCMIQAQILAMEKGENVKKAITDAAKRALEEACTILKKRAAHTPHEGTTPASTGDWSTSGMSGVDSFDWDTLLQDTVLDSDITNTWLFDNWEDVTNST